jgi:hypothetical protein
MAAADLIHLVEDFGAPFGLERSIKIKPGRLDRERYLLSVGRSAFGEPPQRKLLKVARALRLPEFFVDELTTSVDEADVIHFGYEADGGRDIYKIYCEYASDVRRAMADGQGIPTLVHLALKWSADNPESRAVTRYSWIPCKTANDLESRLRLLVPLDRAPSAHRCVFELLSRASAVADPKEFLLMEVEEAGNPRRSCDLNVYDAEMHVGQVIDLVEAAAAGLAVPKSEVRSAFEPVSDKMLGHLSAGVGRNGEEFVTVYFGVEAH